MSENANESDDKKEQLIAPASSVLPASLEGNPTLDYWKNAARAVVAFGEVAGVNIASAAKSTGEMVASATQYAGKKIGEAAVLAGDLNNDGKVDEEDAKIAMAKAKEIGSKIADEAGTLAKEVAKREIVKDAAAGAAIGAAVAIPLPFIGPIGGAVIGAITGIYKNLKTDTKIIITMPGDKQDSTK